MKIYAYIILLLLSLTVQAQSQKELYNQAMAHYESKDYANYLKAMRYLDSIRPMHPVFTYNLASAYALNQQKEKAVSTLEQLILMNNTTAFETDADFKSLETMVAYQELQVLKKQQNELIANSKLVVTLNEKSLHPESVAYLTKTNQWLASSIRKRKIVRFDKATGVCQDWFSMPDMLAVFDMKADSKEKFLWVATAAMPEMENYSASEEGKAEILKIDIKKQTIVARYTTEGNAVFGAIYVTKKNTVFVSDSAKPIIYRIENGKLSVWLSMENSAFNLQGITMNKEENMLFVADYLKGIAAITMANKEVHWLSFPKGVSAKGIDGLVYHNNSLFAIQNGVAPIRIVELMLNKANNQLVDFKVKDNNRPEFDEPAIGTISNGSFYFFANAPWKAYDRNGVLDESKVANPVLYSLKLK